MNLNTYNRQDHFKNGYKISDSDYDQILDKQDPDTNGNGIYNIYEVDKEKIATFIEKISNDRYFSTNSNTLVEKIKYTFGAFNSYRVISQAYLEQNLAIEPILREYTKTKYNVHKYSITLDYPSTLYEYLSDIGTLQSTDINKYRGSIFFVLKDDNVKNMGIVLGNNSFGIVLDGDSRLIKHSLEDINDKYPDADIKVVSIP